MKTTRDPRIDAYIAKSAAFARPILRHLRELVHEGCPAVEETIKWGMPTFTHHGILCGMAGFKAHCTFGFWRRGLNKVLGIDRAKADTAMGSLGRIVRIEDLPPDKTLVGYIRRAAAINASGGLSRPSSAKKPRPAPEVPADLAAALRKHQAAAAAFENFSPSHRREYIEWIAEAKRDETRQRRLATTLEWLAAGKSRNWKYENC